MSGGARVTLTERQVQALVRAIREALAGDLLRIGEIADVHGVLELLDKKLPPADNHQWVGVATRRLLLRDEILRLLAVAEDEGRSALTVWELDDRLTDKPAGTSIQRVVDELAREKLIVARREAPRLLSLMREGRAHARRMRTGDLAEHRIERPEKLLDLIYRARVGGLSRWLEDGREVAVDAIWHEPTVQGSAAGLDADQFAAFVLALEADALVGAASGSYRTITETGRQKASRRFAEHRLPGGSSEPARLLPPVRRPGELSRRPEDLACPLCGCPASWLRTRKGKRYDELRAVGLAEHACTHCSVRWIVYT
jgi:hypothetical protein